MYADDFLGIPAALAQNEALRRRMIALIDEQPIPAKATEGPGRVDALRRILRDLASGQQSLARAIERVRVELPPRMSSHRFNERVFPDRWDERLVRTEFSRFYNQAVLEELLERKEARCDVPHSSAEDPESPCSQELAGRAHDVAQLHALLVESYAWGRWSKIPKIPDHPYCTHVVKPVPTPARHR